jgi:peroxiredoxin Q/BCP
MKEFKIQKKSHKSLLLFLAVLSVGIGLLVYGRQKSAPSVQVLDYLIGRPAPAFTLSDRQGNVYTLDKLKGKNVVLFFNEGLICYPACWDEISALGRDSRFAANGAVVLSVVVDTPEMWQQAIDRMPTLGQAKIVFDTGAKVSSEYDMLNVRSSMHSGKLPGHTYVLIDKQGVVRQVFDDIAMGQNGDRLLAEIKKINQ